MTKVTIISINSPDELTGGGHYLRCLIKGYEDVFSSINVIGKRCKKNKFNFTDKISFYTKSKNVLSDLFSRLLLCPSYLLVYFFSICEIVKDSNVIAFHSSRLGILACLIHFVYPDKKLICHFDNVEYLLLKDKVKSPNVSVKYIVDVIDFCLIKMSELLCCRFSSKQTFITANDADYFGLASNEIIPICYEKTDPLNLSSNVINGGYYLFTASFDFEPNVKALYELCQIANKNQDVDFIVAGRGLRKYSNLEDSNLKFCDSPSVEKMTLLFENAFAYITPVRLGSGMKTKVAEAMKYGLTIISTRESLFGYEEVLTANYINIYDDIMELPLIFESINGEQVPRSVIIEDFNNYYSIVRVSGVIKRLVVCEKENSSIDS